jgi:hypothetical protein
LNKALNGSTFTGNKGWVPHSSLGFGLSGIPQHSMRVFLSFIFTETLSWCRDLIQLHIAHSVAIKRIVYVAFGVEGVKGIAIVLVEGKPQLDAPG